MQNVTLIGIDLGKHALHLHGQYRRGKAGLREKVSREQLIEFLATFHTCTMVTETCAGAHHLACQFIAWGDRVKLISPQLVPPSSRATKTISWMPRPFARRLRDHRFDSYHPRRCSAKPVGFASGA